MAETLESIAAKLDQLSERFDQRFDDVDKRFDEIDKRLDGVDKQFGAVTETFVALRTYVEFSYTSLEETMTGRFDRLERKLDKAIIARPRPRRRR
jgi:hypothetical protein